MISRLKMNTHILYDQKGNALIQVALMMPIILALTFGLAVFIFMIRDGTIMESAARSAARELGTSKDINLAVSKAEEDLRFGLVSGASVDIIGDRVVVSKQFNLSVPFLSGTSPVTLKKEYTFYEEKDTFYFDKEPELQKSPIEDPPTEGYSGYTGSPYH